MAMKFKLNIFFIFSLDLDKCSAASTKETAHNNQTASYNMVMADWKFIPSGNQTHILSL
jgi:primase-polymerase (primpol)-like protein